MFWKKKLTRIFFASNDKSDFIVVDDPEPKVQNLVMFSDFATKKDRKK